ncbi:MAG: nicotinamide mononucleotide transporter [Flavobacterium sp.]|jgi:nicotinamide mononucleotide transporter|nr:nicotinamide mononucleotide transporter [Flavobacterium sp.]
MVEFLFAQYQNYPTYEIALELTAIFFGLWSVWAAKKNSLAVFPTGIINTGIYVYLLWKWALLGDMLINAYYVIMSIYGWVLWSKKDTQQNQLPITRMQPKEYLYSGWLFLAALVFVVMVYLIFGKFTHWTSYVDTGVTGLFFVGMWLMARRKIENWLFWIAGDLISIPLYFAKGYTFTSIQYLIFTIIALYGYLEWKNNLNSSKAAS